MSMASFRSLRWVDYIFLAILDPRSLGRLLNARGFLIPTLILPAAVAITEILCLSRFGHQSGFFLYKISYGWIFLFILITVKVFGLAAVIDLTAQFFGLKGSYLKTLTLVMVSMFPYMFLLPLVTVFTTIHAAPFFFYVLGSLVATAWSLYIIILGVAEFHEIPFSKACAVVLVPCVVLGVVVFLSTILVLALGYGAISNSNIFS